MNTISWRNNLIRDGFTQSGYIAEREGLHGAMRFTFRPMLPEVLDNIEAHRSTKKGSDETALVVAAITERLVTWGELSATGNSEEISTENVRRLRSPLLYRVYNIIAGIEASDKDPEQKADASGLPPLHSSLMEQLKN